MITETDMIKKVQPSIVHAIKHGTAITTIDYESFEKYCGVIIQVLESNELNFDCYYRNKHQVMVVVVVDDTAEFLWELRVVSMTIINGGPDHDGSTDGIGVSAAQEATTPVPDQT